jgi:DNA-binding NarL/FixJ family response regulator
MLAADGLDGELAPGLPATALLCARGALWNALGRHADAREDFLTAAKRVGWLPYTNPEAYGWRPGLALAELALGRHEEALALAVETVEIAREAGGTRGIGVTLRVHGVVAGAEGIDLLREAVETLTPTTARLHHAHALVDLGAALRRSNRRRDSREPLQAGMELARRCGARPLEERARTELAATGARPRKVALSGVESLTPSELRVASLAADGTTSREIAQALFVSVKTVEFHLRHCFQKLDIERRTELASALATDSAPVPAP